MKRIYLVVLILTVSLLIFQTIVFSSSVSLNQDEKSRFTTGSLSIIPVLNPVQLEYFRDYGQNGNFSSFSAAGLLTGFNIKLPVFISEKPLLIKFNYRQINIDNSLEKIFKEDILHQINLVNLSQKDYKLSLNYHYDFIDSGYLLFKKGYLVNVNKLNLFSYGLDGQQNRFSSENYFKQGLFLGSGLGIDLSILNTSEEKSRGRFNWGDFSVGLDYLYSFDNNSILKSRYLSRISVSGFTEEINVFFKYEFKRNFSFMVGYLASNSKIKNYLNHNLNLPEKTSTKKGPYINIKWFF